MGRLSDRRVVHVEIAADGTDHHLAGVQPHSNRQRDPGRAAHFLGMPLHRLLHPERGVAGPDGMVLVGHWRAEEGHDAVPHHLVYRALIAVDGLHHVL